MVINIECLVSACTRLNLQYQFSDANKNVVTVTINGQKYLFANAATPFNTDSQANVFADKGFTHDLLSHLNIIPKTVGYPDPATDLQYQSYVEHKNMGKISDNILNNFSLPVIIKKNRGYKGVNVFSCDSKDEIQKSLEIIFNKDSRDYDYLALAQDKINIKQEFRAIVFGGVLLLTYLKDNSKAKFIGNLSPLHWDGAKTVVVSNDNTLGQITKLVYTVNSRLPIGFAGLDLAIDQNGKLWLIEINSRPGFDLFVRDNGKDKIVAMYESILKKIAI
jgi:hypothetical protein